MIVEVENSRIELFQKSIIELAEALKHTPENFELKMKFGIITFGSQFKKILPNDTIKFIKKGNKIILEFSLIGFNGKLPKKRKTHLQINCAPGEESMNQKRMDKKTYTKLPIKLDSEMCDKLAGELARSAVSSHYDEFKISSLHPKISKPEHKKKKNEIVHTKTAVNLEVVYHKDFVNKRVSDQNDKLIQVSRRSQSDKMKEIKIDYEQPCELNMNFLGPIIQLLYIELPFYDAVWRVVIGITDHIKELGFPARIRCSQTNLLKVEIKKGSYETDLKKITKASFEIPE